MIGRPMVAVDWESMTVLGESSVSQAGGLMTLWTERESGTGWRGGAGEAEQVFCHMSAGISIRWSHDIRRGPINMGIGAR